MNRLKICAITFLLLFELGCSLFATPGSGTIISEDRTLGTFDQIRIEGQASLDVQYSTTQSITVTTDDNLIDMVETLIEGQTLVVRNRFGTWMSPTEGIQVKIVMTQQPSQVAISGTGDFTWTDTTAIDTADFSLFISGSGSATFTHTGSTLAVEISGSGSADITGTHTSSSVNISGSGDVTLTGSSDTANLTISGHGNYRAFAYTTQNTDITISGSGSAEVYVTGVLNVSISGSGNVSYRGGPTLHINNSGTGIVTPG